MALEKLHEIHGGCRSAVSVCDLVAVRMKTAGMMSYRIRGNLKLLR